MIKNKLMQYYVVKIVLFMDKGIKWLFHIVSLILRHVKSCIIYNSDIFFLLSERSLKKVWDASSFLLPRFHTFMNHVNYN